MRHATLILLVPLLFCPHASAEEFRAGTAVIGITPPVGYRMSGYFRERLSTGTHDPLQAKAIVLQQGDVQAALVFCDLAGIPLNVSQPARRQASRRTGIPAAHIAIAATHSHTGPLYFGALRAHFHRLAVERHGSDPHEAVDYPNSLTEKIALVIKQAQQAAAPVRLQHGVAKETRLSFNRRFHMKDGSVRFNPGTLNPNIVRPAGPIDPDVGIVKVTSPNGTPLSSLVVFALHLDTVGGTLYSADYPKYLSDALQGEFGEHFISLFGEGTCGDINHVDVTVRGRRTAKEIGTMLAETVRGQMSMLAPLENASLAVRHATVDVPLQRYSDVEVQEAAERMALIGSRQLSFLDQVKTYKITDLQLRTGDTIGLQIQAFRLGPDLAIVTLPGEVFVDLGLAIKRASPFKTTLVIELANDAPGYLPTKRAFAEGSYETVNSRIEPGGAEAMTEAAIRLLTELAPAG